MKTVVHIVNGKVVRQEVPNDWIKCSVLGEYRPPEEFRDEGAASQTRTNCTRTYLMPMAEWDHHKAVAKSLKKQLDTEFEKLNKEQLDKTAGKSVDDLIAELVELKRVNPNARIVVEIDGEWHDTNLFKADGFNNIFTL